MVERQTQNWELLLPSGSGMTPPGTPTGKLREKRGISMPIRSSIPSAEMMTKSTGKDLAEKAPGEDISATEVRGKNPTSPTKSGKTAADAKQEGLGIEKQKAADTEGEQEGEVTEKEKENKDEKKAAGAARAEPGEHGEGQDQVRCAPQ